MPVVGGPGRLHEQLPAHAQVAEQGVPVVQGQPEVLAASPGGLDPASGEGQREALGTARVAADRARVEDVDPGDGPAEHVAGEARPDDLDLGELGHVGRLGRQSLAAAVAACTAGSSTPRSAAISPYAVSAAACSASFLERPTPLP